MSVTVGFTPPSGWTSPRRVYIWQAFYVVDRLRRRLLRQLVRIGDYWEHVEDLQQAADIYEEGLRVDACAEDVCRRLMRVYHNLGRPAEIRATNHRCQQALTTNLETLPFSANGSSV